MRSCARILPADQVTGIVAEWLLRHRNKVHGFFVFAALLACRGKTRTPQSAGCARTLIARAGILSGRNRAFAERPTIQAF
jgi:hypothetical protein